MTASKQLLVLAGMSIFLILGLSLAPPALAQINANTTGLADTAISGGYLNNTVSIPVLIGRIIDIIVGLVGLILFILYIYAGVMWMTAQGDPTKVGKAKGILTTSTIGLIIVLSAFAITNFVVTQLGDATAGATLSSPSDSEILIEDE